MFDENYLGIMFSSLNMELAPTVLSVCTLLPMKKKKNISPHPNCSGKEKWSSPLETRKKLRPGPEYITTGQPTTVARHTLTVQFIPAHITLTGHPCANNTYSSSLRISHFQIHPCANNTYS